MRRGERGSKRTVSETSEFLLGYEQVLLFPLFFSKTEKSYCGNSPVLLSLCAHAQDLLQVRPERNQGQDLHPGNSASF